MSNPVLDSLVQGIEERTAQIGKFMDPVFNEAKTNFAHMGMQGMPSQFPESIMVFGCGGTGGWLAPKLVKILNDAMNKRMADKFTVLFVDGDEIEEKNLIRQNFITQDIGKNKAEVMAERYGIHFHDKIDVGFIDTYLVDKYYDVPEEFATKFGRIEDVAMFQDRSPSLIINLIDNGKTRKLIHKFASSKAVRGKVFNVLDVANNEYNGQLNLSSYGSGNPSAYLSQFYNVHPTHLGDEEDISVFSCADADAEAVDQLFNANDMAATVTGTYLNAWIQENKVKYGAVEFVTGLSMSVKNLCPLIDFDMSTTVGPSINEVTEQAMSGVISSVKSNLSLEEGMIFELGYSKAYQEIISHSSKNNQYFKDLDHACSSNSKAA